MVWSVCSSFRQNSPSRYMEPHIKIHANVKLNTCQNCIKMRYVDARAIFVCDSYNICTNGRPRPGENCLNNCHWKHPLISRIYPWTTGVLSHNIQLSRVDGHLYTLWPSKLYVACVIHRLIYIYLGDSQRIYLCITPWNIIGQWRHQ